MSCAQARVAAGRNAQPTAAVIDSQSVRAADTVPRASRGWDNAKKVNGRKRRIAVDVMGLVLDVVITAASVQDRQGARPLLWNTHRACRRVRLGDRVTKAQCLVNDMPDGLAPRVGDAKNPSPLITVSRCPASGRRAAPRDAPCFRPG